ncbi:hypothetical protein [Paenibacillus pinihumi]|nr:hypothetical protein [Paenibacillus pinihumi]
MSNKRERAPEIQEQIRQWFEDEKELLLQVLHHYSCVPLGDNLPSAQ